MVVTHIYRSFFFQNIDFMQIALFVVGMYDTDHLQIGILQDGIAGK